MQFRQVGVQQRFFCCDPFARIECQHLLQKINCSSWHFRKNLFKTLLILFFSEPLQQPSLDSALKISQGSAPSGSESLPTPTQEVTRSTRKWAPASVYSKPLGTRLFSRAFLRECNQRSTCQLKYSLVIIVIPAFVYSLHANNNSGALYHLVTTYPVSTAAFCYCKIHIS
jgi:hypothetical protein